MTDEYVLVLTTWPEGGDAAAFARILVEERLAACVNILPGVTSVYRWQGTVESETERQLWMKTRRACVRPLWERVRALHPYETPEFVVLPVVDGSDAYLAWIGDSTRAPA